MKTLLLTMLALAGPVLGGFQFDLAGVAKGRKGTYDGKVLVLTDKPAVNIKARPHRPGEPKCYGMDLFLTGEGKEAGTAAAEEIKWWAVRALNKPEHKKFMDWLAQHSSSGTYIAGDVRIVITTTTVPEKGLKVTFDHKAPPVLLTAKLSSYGRKDTYSYRTDWGSFDKDFVQHMALEIEVRNNAAEKLPLKIVWLAMAEDLNTKEPLVAAWGADTMEIEPSHSNKIITDRLEAEGRKARYVYLGENIKEGAKLTTWGVQVQWKKEILAVFSPKPDVATVLRQKFIDTAAAADP